MHLKAVALAGRAERLDNPEDGLAAVTALRAHLESLEARHVEAAVRLDFTWARIAALLGVSKQAAHKKHAARVRSRAGYAEPMRSEREALVVMPQVRQAVRNARQEADSLKHPAIGPEHLLLALLRDDRGPAAEALEALGVSFAAARREVRRLYGEADEPDPKEGASSENAEVPVSNRARLVINAAVTEASRGAERRLAPEHVLRALLRDAHGGAIGVLASLGVTPAEVERKLDGRIRLGSPADEIGQRASRSDASEEKMVDRHKKKPGGPTARRGKHIDREKLDGQRRERLPASETISVDTAVIGAPPGPDLPEVLPDHAEADEHAPLYRIRTED